MLRSIPVDGTRLGALRCVGVEPKYTDFESKAPKLDREGRAQYAVSVAVKVPGRKAELIEITISGEPVGLEEGAVVHTSGLEAVPWTIEGRSGVSFRAEAITPAVPPRSGKGGDA